MAIPTPNIEPLGLQFAYPWRPEQARVLDQLSSYMDDQRIHIVAAPGAGKTVIGLEIFNRLQLRALAISPTIIVRDQWLDRLINFLPNEHNTNKRPEWCGTDLETPHLFTSTTYQGLFSFDQQLSGAAEDDVEAQYSSLKHWLSEQDIRLLILDEAHHLKAAWWTVLIRLVESNNDLIVVSLTATPPYDASPLEWSRYQQLCGEVDEEISIPELVRSHSLCPHQDYIWMVHTDANNVTALHRQQQQLTQFIAGLGDNQELLYQLQLHRWLDEATAPDTQAVLTHLDEALALLGLLKYQSIAPPDHLLQQLEMPAATIQPITQFGWEQLLQSFLEGSHYPDAPPVHAYRDTLRTLLSSKRFLKYNKVSLDNSQKKLEAFNKTQERIQACLAIAQVEFKTRQAWMRLVVLSDFIRDEKYQLALNGMDAPTGAYPIFHHYIHHLDADVAQKTALLTGRLSIIHQDCLLALSEQLPGHVSLATETYSENPDYVVLKQDSHHLSKAMTSLHQRGDLLILVGTRGLLGEGWDAPHVNSLILATQTGAYVTTNQIRGRAIRIDPDDDLKTASIWHIIAIAPEQAYNQFILKDLHRRFKTFAGIHANEPRIESGIERLELHPEEQSRVEEKHTNPTEHNEDDLVARTNRAMIQRLEDDIYNLQARWQNALEKVEKHVFQSGLQIDTSLKQPRDNLSRYIARVQTSSWLAFLRWVQQLLGKQQASYPERFARVLLDALQQTEQLPAPTPTTPTTNSSPITVLHMRKGYYRFSLNGFPRHANDIFLESLSQLLEPIQQPRYVIALKKHADGGDIFPVPHRLGRKKAFAVAFLRAWKQHLPEFKDVSLHATWTPVGRKHLLRARLHTYAEQETDTIRLIERWE